jgi:molybdate transport system substrate-binding protein
MAIHRAAAALVAVLLSLMAGEADAAELKVLASTAIKGVLEELGPQYEKASGNRLMLTYGPAAMLKTQIDEGAPFDLAVLTPPLIDALVAEGKLDGATRVAIARAGLGVSVHAGAPKPDVGTASALKQVLLAAKSIGFNGVGASRAGIEAALGKLGIADAVMPKIVLLNVSAPVAVAKGDVEMGLGPVSEILAVSGAENAGAFPIELQSYLTMTAATAAGSKDAGLAEGLVKFLTAPAAGATIKAKGMEPG